MKIAFLYMGDITHVPSTIFGPLGISYIASHIEKYGGYDDIHLEVDPNRIIDLKPDIVGIGTYTDTYDLAKKYAYQIKNKLDIPVVIGGPHMTSLPQTMDKIFDVGAVGEAEDTFLELLKLYDNNQFNTKHFKNIKSLVFHEDNDLIFTPRRPDIVDLDYIPSPKRELLKYIKDGKTLKWTQHIHSSRGCPYECIFCNAKKISGKVRYHSPEQIIIQIQDILENFNQPEITFSDDLFTLNVNRLERIAELIEKEKLNKYCSFTCCVRANRLTERVCEIFQRMNMKTVCFGFESGDDTIIKYLKDLKMTVESNQEAINLSQKYDMKIIGNFIIGSPPETKEQLANTYWFVHSNRKKIGATYFCHATPFPMISWWDEAINRGLMKENEINWKALNVGFDEKDSVFMNENYSKDYFKEAYQHFKSLEQLVSLNSKPNLIFGKESINSYYENIYSSLNTFIEKNDTNFLIISDKSKEYYIKDKINVKTDYIIYDNKELKIPNKKYDLIFFDHCYEQFEDFEIFIENIRSFLNKKGKLLFLIYNPTHISNIISIINSDLEGFIERKNYSLDNLKSILSKKSFKLKQDENYHFVSKEFVNKHIVLISYLSSLKNKLPIKDYNIYSKYLLFEKN